MGEELTAMKKEEDFSVEGRGRPGGIHLRTCRKRRKKGGPCYTIGERKKISERRA